MSCTAIVASCPLLHHISHVDDIGVWLDGDRYPAFGGRIPDFQTFRSFLLEQYSDAAKVCVITDCICQQRSLGGKSNCLETCLRTVVGQALPEEHSGSISWGLRVDHVQGDTKRPASSSIPWEGQVTESPEAP